MSDKQKLEEELVELQKQYSKTKYNKATDKYLGILRAKIANIKKRMSERKHKKGMGFAVKKTGDATIALVGFPNTGKSSLLRMLTGVESKVADYAFTTVDVIPGMLRYKGANIQILDLPGLIEGAHIGRGGGTQVSSVIRVSDLLLFVVDSNNPGTLYTLIKELSELGIKVGKERPNIKIERLNSGGIRIENNRYSAPNRDVTTRILNEFGVYNASLSFMQDASEDDLIDALTENSIYIDAIVALNKIDLNSEYLQTKNRIERELGMEVVSISALKNLNIEKLKEAIFERLRLNRIYLKPRYREPDFNSPVILKQGSSVYDIAKKLHTKMANNLRCAYVTGKSVRFKNQKVGREHVLSDEDVVTLVYA